LKNLGEVLSGLVGTRREHQPAAPHPREITQCPKCGEPLTESELFRNYRLCPSCRHHFSVPAMERISMLVDDGSFKEVNRWLASIDPLSFTDKVPYRQRLHEAQRRTGLIDAAVTGLCRIGGIPAVIAVLDFEFMGGSMGSVVGEKIALAFELALKHRVPMVTVSSSGGARMQEGILSLMQMAKTSAAARRLRQARIPFLSILADPTTGGLLASFASLGDIIIAEPKALIGFAGPRVIEQAMGVPLPPNSHSAEFLLQHGHVDMVVDRTKLRDTLIVLLDLLTSRYRLASPAHPERFEAKLNPSITAWERVQLARHPDRPTTMDYIRLMTSTFVELHGDRHFGDDPAIVAGIGELAGQPVAIIGHERGHGDEVAFRRNGRALPEGYRKAQRVMRLAATFGLPVITLIDTPGAYPGLEGEERGVAGAIAESLALMSELPTPIIAAVIGEGGSGGALALAVADRILMQENAIYAVISPEGAAAILYRDATRAEELAPAMKLTAHDCRLLGVIDVVVPEPPGGAHTDPAQAAWQLKHSIVRELLEIQGRKPRRLIAERYQKFRRMGQMAPFYSAVLNQLKERIPAITQPETQTR
jgi:acetyl-CoA carboxylase carboxyl transferase beta subunit/acetyl-CoA carboxylase carboxyl transferase alpha subunit